MIFLEVFFLKYLMSGPWYNQEVDQGGQEHVNGLQLLNLWGKGQQVFSQM